MRSTVKKSWIAYIFVNRVHDSYEIRNRAHINGRFRHVSVPEHLVHPMFWKKDA